VDQDCELRIVHLVAVVEIDSERWQGEGVVPYPDSSDGWENWTNQVTRSIQEGLMPLLSATGDFRFKLEAESYTMRGPIARLMRAKLAKLRPADPAAFNWTPVTIEVFMLQGGNTHGS